jgi:hypothetical protein
MSLSARQERDLGRIERSLHADEPRLTSMFAIFTKLAREEEMPRLEELGSRWLPLRGWRNRLARSRPGGGRGKRVGDGAPDTRLDARRWPTLPARAASQSNQGSTVSDRIV